MVEKSRPYHYGDLRSALLAAGLSLTRTGGPKALAIREVTRSVGVSPSAAYRHFEDQRALVIAVAHKAQDLLARAMLDKMNALTQGVHDAERALAGLRGVGLGYIHFAVTEPGWFELAILTFDEPLDDASSVTTQGKVPPPYQLLLDALDGMLDAEVITPDQRANAEWPCWSAVHGFADLATRGPLQTQARATIDHLAEHVVDTTIQGIQASSGTSV